MVRHLAWALVWLVAAIVPARAIDYVVPEAGLRFPDRLGGFVLEGGQQAPRLELGHILQYAGRNFIGSVYVYNGGRPSVPDGVRNPVVQAEFEQAQSDIFAVARMRGWPAPVKSADAVTRDTSVEFLTATYRLDSPSAQQDSVVAITGARGQFIKVRMTVPAGGDHVDLRAFLQHVGALVTGARAPAMPALPPAAAAIPGAPWEPPQTLARFIRSGEDKFPLFTPLGAEGVKTFPYRHQRIDATVHIYRRDGGPRTDGATSAEIVEEVENIRVATALWGGLSAIAGRSENNATSVLDRRLMSVGTYGGRTMQFQRLVLGLSGGPDPREMPIFVTAWGGQFLRVNLGYAAGEPAGDEVRLFMSALVRALPR